MDILKKRLIGCITIIILCALILYAKAVFSTVPLGLDTLGHLSKVSYIHEFGLTTSWNFAWYNGTPFLAFYSPLFYYINALFSNVILGSNLLVFLSILFTAIGIFSILNYYTKSKTYALIFALFFLSVICTSYYYLSVGNNPYVFALFTIPFTLLFLEKSLENKKYSFLIYVIFFTLAYLSHIFIALCLFLLVFIRITIHIFYQKKTFKEFLAKQIKHLSTPLLLSAFWFFPFLTKTKSFIGDGIGYTPTIGQLFGVKEYIIWGLDPGAIGIALLLFLASFLIIKRYIQKEKIASLFISSVVLLLLLVGILGRHYPTGVGAIRFVVPFAILMCIYLGVIIQKHFKGNQKVIIILAVLLIIALVQNYTIIQKNYEHFSYHGENDRFGAVTQIYPNPDFPVQNNITNYRFGAFKYFFGETMTFYNPRVSQTWGYFDQGILYPEGSYHLREVMRDSKNITEIKQELEKNAIKYFEVGGEDIDQHDVLKNDADFIVAYQQNFTDYPFYIYEYKKATPIISVPNQSEYRVKRDHPDKIQVNFNFSGEEQILIKEYFHPSWKAKETTKGKTINIEKTEDSFMKLTPPKGANEVLIYQTSTTSQKTGLIVTLLTLISLIAVSFKRN